MYTLFILLCLAAVAQGAYFVAPINYQSGFAQKAFIVDNCGMNTSTTHLAISPNVFGYGDNVYGGNPDAMVRVQYDFPSILGHTCVCPLTKSFYIYDDYIAAFATSVETGPLGTDPQQYEYDVETPGRVRGMGVVGSTVYFGVSSDEQSAMWSADWPSFDNAKALAGSDASPYDWFVVDGSTFYTSTDNTISSYTLGSDGTVTLGASTVWPEHTILSFIATPGGWSGLVVDNATDKTWIVQATSLECVRKIAEIAPGHTKLAVFPDQFVECAAAPCIALPPAPTPAPAASAAALAEPGWWPVFVAACATLLSYGMVHGAGRPADRH